MVQKWYSHKKVKSQRRSPSTAHHSLATMNVRQPIVETFSKQCQELSQFVVKVTHSQRLHMLYSQIIIDRSESRIQAIINTCSNVKLTSVQAINNTRSNETFKNIQAINKTRSYKTLENNSENEKRSFTFKTIHKETIVQIVTNTIPSI